MGGRNRGVSRPRSLHLNDDAHPEAQRDIIAKLLQVSESSPVIGVKDPLCSRLLGISGPVVKQRRGRRDEAEERPSQRQILRGPVQDRCASGDGIWVTTLDGGIVAKTCLLRILYSRRGA